MTLVLFFAMHFKPTANIPEVSGYQYCNCMF